MLTFLADSNVLFVIRLGFGTGNVAHGIIYLRLLFCFETNYNYIYSIYRYLSTDYYYMLWVQRIKFLMSVLLTLQNLLYIKYNQSLVRRIAYG